MIRRRLASLLGAAFLLCGAVLAQQLPTLDAQHLLLDGSLSDTEASKSPYVFNNFQDAAAHFGDTVTLYLRPWVYWVDNPDVPEVAVGKDGREPFGCVIHAKIVHFIGLGERPQDVVLASMRGQTQGAVGNFTMFDFHVDSLTVENLTMGNYCNVDLDYPLRPELSRKKRNDAITQAHVGYVHGRQLVARRVRFISRLNLNPLTGAEESYYEDCHFECTDDAMNGNAVYRHCTVDLYGQKPFWSTHGRGAMFIDCDFHVCSDNREMYFCKQGGPLALIGCRYHAPSDSIYVGWTAYPQPWLRCYVHDFTLNGRPYTIGHRQPENTVTLSGTPHPARVLRPGLLGSRDIPFLPISQHEFTLQTGTDTLTLTATDSVHWRVPPAYSSLVSLRPVYGGNATAAPVAVVPTNNTDETATFCVEAYTDDGLQAACQLTVKPSPLPPPTFARRPRIKVKDGVAQADYQLDLQGRRDESAITWLRDGVPVSVSHLLPERAYQLTGADVGHKLSMSVAPKHQRSAYGPAVTASMKSAISAKSVNILNVLETDFHDFPCGWQPQVMAGFWTVDGYKPADTAEFPWAFDADKPMWAYAEGFNGAVGYGLLQAQRGARLMYTPAEKAYGDMTLTLQVDPTKTAGQGFGSATGQYMDVCLKFDTRTLSGYGLRIIRTTKSAKAVDFLLVRYDHGTVTPLTDATTATCYRTGCTIVLHATAQRLTADVTTTTPRPAGSPLPHEVHLQAPIEPTTCGGLHIQHTGTCGESTTMLHQLRAEWE